jgi:hypothetical protein
MLIEELPERRWQLRLNTDAPDNKSTVDARAF